MSAEADQQSINHASNRRFKYSRDIFSIHDEDGNVLSAITIAADSYEDYQQAFIEAGTYFRLVESVALNIQKADDHA